MHHFCRQHGLWLLVAALCLLTLSCGKSTQITSFSIIPEPTLTALKDGTFTCSSSTRLCFENIGQNTPTAKYISQSLRRMHIRPTYSSTPGSNCVTFSVNDTVNPALGDEGYVIRVQPDAILINANTETGLFYAFQTFVQMLPDDMEENRYKSIVLPECTIMDCPRFAWRGSHLDCCRHFFTVKQIKRHLDLMAAYKLNRFHWHLADDQGWRIEIERYPQLTDIGAWRVDRTQQPWGKADPPMPDEEPTYGGYYSREEIAEIIAYAAELHIEVIPEIDLPNHCSALLAAYPEYSCDGGPYQVQNGPCPESQATLCVGNANTLDFVYGILDEVAQLFPSEYIHIGGGACSTDHWKACPLCQAHMRQLHLTNEHQLQGWIITQIADSLSRKGKRIICRDEVLGCGVSSSDIIINAWSSADAPVQAARGGHPVIAALADYCNLDRRQADSLYHPVATNIFLPLSQAYQFEPIPAGLVEAEQSFIWGGEAVFWSDYAITYSDAEYMILPRLCALAECFWTQSDNRDWSRFQQKIESHKQRLRLHGYHCCNGSFRPLVTQKKEKNNVVVTLSPEVLGSTFHYTTNGTAPTAQSALYTHPLRLAPGTQLRVCTSYQGMMQDGVYEFRVMN